MRTERGRTDESHTHRTAGRRVRHQARDAVALMAFSATTSTALAAGLLLLAHLGR
jgi:hypothetical protein